jgi:LysM repeat protein
MLFPGFFVIRLAATTDDSHRFEPDEYGAARIQSHWDSSPGGADGKAAPRSGSTAPPKAVQVYLGSEKLGTTLSSDFFLNQLRHLEERYRWFANDETMMDLLRFEETQLADNIFLLNERLRASFESYADQHQKGWSIQTDGIDRVFLESSESANGVIRDIKSLYVPEIHRGEVLADLTVTMAEEYKIAPVLTSREKVLTPELAIKMLLRGTTEEKSYRIASGDSVWTISRRYDLTVEDIIKANPGLDPDKIYAGDELSLIVPKPFLVVRTSFRRTFTQPIPYRTHIRLDPGELRTRIFVQQVGKHGEERVVERIVSYNGIVLEREILGRETLSPPRVRILRKGTQRTPDDILVASAFLPGGMGIITSYFGRRWGRLHQGVDVAVPIGTPVFAIRTGRVTSAPSSPDSSSSNIWTAVYLSA